MPNYFALFVFYTWPLVVIWIFKRNPTHIALALSYLLCILYLPAAYVVDLPMLPPINRETLTTITILAIHFSKIKKIFFVQSKIVFMLFAALLCSVFITNATNQFPIMIGGRYIPPTSMYDGLSDVIQQMLWFSPFLLGRYFVNDVKYNEGIFKVVAKLFLFYSLLMLFEIRMSPQIHNWIYGYAPSDFIQQMRGDGFRPMVFVGHGLPLAFIFAAIVVCTMVLAKNKVKFSTLPTKTVLIYFVIVLVFCKTMSAFIYLLFGYLLIFRLKPAKAGTFAVIFSFLVMLYPAAKVLDVFPEKQLVELAAGFSQERADSLQFRFDNEKTLTEKALKQPWFGWGGWGRNRIYDLENGNDSSVTDGVWVIKLGTFGVVGFVIYYLLFFVSVHLANKSLKYIEDKREANYVVTLLVLSVINMIDTIPNTGGFGYHMLLFGALLGQSQQIIANRKNDYKARASK